MEPLCLTPLPTRRADEQSSILLMERDGFVDEAVVTALVMGSHLGRNVADLDDLALAADDLDFAGWRLSRSVTVRSAEVPPQVIEAIVRRAVPVETGEVNRDFRQSPSTRWWAGMVALSRRLAKRFETLFSLRWTLTNSRNDHRPMFRGTRDD